MAVDLQNGGYLTAYVKRAIDALVEEGKNSNLRNISLSISQDTGMPENQICNLIKTVLQKGTEIGVFSKTGQTYTQGEMFTYLKGKRQKAKRKQKRRKTKAPKKGEKRDPLSPQHRQPQHQQQQP